MGNTIISVLVKDQADIWKFFMLMPCIPTPFLFIATYWMSPSPRFIMQKKGYEAGLEVLKAIRKMDPTEEAKAIWKTIEEENNMEKLKWKEVFVQKSLRTRTMTALFINMFQQFSLVNFLINAVSSLWIQAGLPANMESFSALIQQGTFLVAVSIASIWLIDLKCIGRRGLYIIGTSLCCLSAILSYIGAEANNYSLIFYSSLILFSIGFQISHGLLAWAYPAELFTIREKNKVYHLFYMSQWIVQIVFVGFMQYYFSVSIEDFQKLGPWFILLNALPPVYGYFFLEETCGVPLEEVAKKFERSPRGHWPLK